MMEWLALIDVCVILCVNEQNVQRWSYIFLFFGVIWLQNRDKYIFFIKEIFILK